MQVSGSHRALNGARDVWFYSLREQWVDVHDNYKQSIGSQTSATSAQIGLEMDQDLVINSEEKMPIYQV